VTGEKIELKRLLEGVAPGERPRGVGLVVFEAQCASSANEVHEKVREVLQVVLSQSGDHWPTLSTWKELLPSWFVVACAPEKTLEDQERWLQWFKNLPSDEQSLVQNQAPWTLAGWLYWLQPENRSWFWWNGSVVSDDILRVEVEVDSSPFASGALEWILRAAGATGVDMRG